MKASIKPQPHTRKKRPKEKQPVGPIKLLIILLAFFVPGVLVYIWLHVQTVNFSYDIAKTQKQKRELSEMNKKLRIQLANLKSPERIERIALTQLGLKPPEKGQIEIIK
ncbi:MAG: cell division protein FtsL [Desulfobacca sp.]|nr:cell division protein FtsL [Desulfobacca sp.]